MPIRIKYFVSYFLHNKENDGWAYKVVASYNDLSAAKKAYHTELSTYINSTTYDNVAVSLTDSYGNKIMSEYWQAPAETEQTEPTTNEEGE